MSAESPTSTRYQLPALSAALFERLPQGIALFDRGLRLVYANDSWASFLERVTGATGALRQGAGFGQLLPAADDLCEAAQACLTGGAAIRLPARSWATNGGAGFWDVTLSPLVEGSVVTGVTCVVDDATDRAAAEHAAAAQARLAAFRADVSQALASSDEVDAVLQSCAEAMVHHAPAAFARIWVLDEAEDVYRLRASAGLYTRLNGTYARIPADWIRQKTFRTYAPDVETNLREHQVRDPKWAEREGLVAWANHPLVVRGEIIGFMAMFARQPFDDDTLNELAAVADAIAQFLERKRAEAESHERELLFRSIFEAAGDGLVIYDLDTVQLLEANPALCAMHGYPRAACTRLSRADLVHPDSRQALHDYLTVVRGGRASRVRLQHVRQDGSVFPVAIQGSPIVYRGRPAALSIVRDVTQEQAAQEQLEQRVAERTQDLSLLLDVSRSVASTLELQPLLAVILEQLKPVVPYTGAAVLTLDGDDLIIAGQQGPLSAADARAMRYSARGLAPVWQRLEAGEGIVIDDVRDDSLEACAFRAAVLEELDQRHGFIGSCLIAPLIVQDQLIGLLSITSQQTSGFGPRQLEMATAIAREAAVAIANARLHEQVRTVAALEERQRLARELHDAVTQTLFSASLIGDVLPTLWSRNPRRAGEALEDLRLLTRGALAEMRTLLFELRPAALTETPLGDLLQYLAQSVTGRTRLPIAVTIDQVGVMVPEVQIAFYRIAQEALNNVVKHADATRVDLRLARTPAGELELTIHDDGRGFEPGEQRGGHFGLRTMAERASAIGARLSVRSDPGAGSDIAVSWSAGATNNAEDA